MVIVKVTFTDWNGQEHQREVTSDKCPSLAQKDREEEIIYTAICYIKRRYTEWVSVDAVEIIAR
jgi:hypothetical protein